MYVSVLKVAQFSETYTAEEVHETAPMWEQKFVKMKKTMQECFNKAGTYKIMTWDIKNHEKPQGQSVSGLNVQGLSVLGV